MITTFEKISYTLALVMGWALLFKVVDWSLNINLKPLKLLELKNRVVCNIHAVMIIWIGTTAVVLKPWSSLKYLQP
jgi:hypothetical protein